MSTLRDLIDGTFRLINVNGQGVSANIDQINNALYALDTMTDGWSTEKLMIYSIQPHIFYTVPGQQVYTLGPQNDTPGTILSFSISTLSTGTGYVDGTYNNVVLLNGTGTGATANITVVKGAVIDVQVVNGGKNYLMSDVLTAANTSLGGTGSGFTVTPAQITTLS